MYIYGFILQFLHILYGVVRLLGDICLHFLKIWFKDDDTERLNSEIKNLKKKPHHMVVMLGNEEPSYKDLANIVMWSAVAGISIISFYDHSGVLKKSKDKLYITLDEYNIKYENGFYEKLKNAVSRSKIYINFLSMLDGQKSVADVTKNCVLNNVRNSDIGIDYVDQKLRKQIGEFPDPELALYCGPICSTYGMLPWQIRLTEFVDINTHHGINLSKFKLALERFAKCEQRLGV